MARTWDWSSWLDHWEKKQWSSNSTIACAVKSPRNGKGWKVPDSSRAPVTFMQVENFMKQMSFYTIYIWFVYSFFLIFNLFFFPKRSQKLGCVFSTGTHYTRVNSVIQHVWLLSQSQKDFCGYWFKEAKPLSYQAISPSGTSHGS